ncbi:TIGR03862 family flavoprotein [Hyphomicrobium sp. 99]|uniref:TIGR03862 family flavoprotein n=1 Tax=Hyphomicrobium sp. 99 TaxID=1163419 RepID=UPI0005F87808|nr:TIGR03862 family flavoprotein [Hyphomicrobium sp. 99]
MTAQNVAVKDVAVVGAGPAGLFAAEIIARAGHRVTVYERMPSPARKFLLAGRGGLNLTHSEPIENFLPRYGAAAEKVRTAVEAFPPSALIDWANGLGAETFIGSSGRVFPRAMKASPLLRAWLRRLNELGVVIKTRHRWTGFTAEGGHSFKTPEGPIAIRPDATLFALGGASWPKLGSDAHWVETFKSAGIPVTPLGAANCGVLIEWSEIFRSRFEGTALKRIALTFEGITTRGEAIVTRTGLEGGAIYALVPNLRAALRAHQSVTLSVDLKPDIEHSVLAERLAKPRGKETLTNFLRKAAHLDPPALALVREGGASLPEGADALAARIKSVPLTITGLAAIDRAISTAGGIGWLALTDELMVKDHPGLFAAGEMLDWEAPTGGYLLQATFATATRAANGLLAWLATAETE